MIPQPPQILPFSAVVPTLDRASVFERTLRSLAAQCALPAELIVVDGSAGEETRAVAEQWNADIAPAAKLIWIRATELGAATQRNQGLAFATQPLIWFFDDDILFEPECVMRLWQAIEVDPGLGGVNAMITNQRYLPPGRISRTMFALINGRNEPTFAGRLLGPAINLLPEDRDDLPEVVPTEWLNTTCTIYRREALPDPPFDSIFTGYSMMEDVALSARVGRHWRLANARTARIFHDSQPGVHKSRRAELARMEIVNRHFIMTDVMDRSGAADYALFLLWQLFQLSSCAVQCRLGSPFWQAVRGYIQGLRAIATSRSRPAQPIKRPKTNE
jgi:glycosyltransferase involved in cell wall biosynthesis